MLGKVESVKVPSQYVLCYKSNCRRAGECLRYQATSYVSEECSVVRVVNPSIISSEEGCEQFKACRVLKYAYGMTDVLDRLPYRTAKDVRHCLLEHFGKTHFYRLMRKQRCFKPDDQAYVEMVFRKFEIASELIFDSYQLDYEW